MTPKICLAYVHPGAVRHEFMASVLRTSKRYDLRIISVESGANIQHARNECVQRFLATDSDYLFFVDTDMTWEIDVPEHLIACGAPIVSALYLGRERDGTTYPVGKVWVGDGMMMTIDLEDLKGLTEVAGVGMGCCMIQREVLQKLMANQPDVEDWPFAVGEFSSPMGPVAVSEDINFCLRADIHGYRSYIASDIHAGHVKSFVIAP